MAMYHPSYLKRIRDICDRYRVHLIADEIAVGFGRTGTMFACEQADIRPDFICLSKGITGGYLPLSAVLTTDRVYAAFYDDAVSRGFLHSHSYTGNALACRAALATLDIFADDQIIATNRAKASQFNALLTPLQHHPAIRHFRQQGMIWAFDVQSDDPAFARRFYLAGLQRGLLLRPIGTTVYFMPPYILTLEEMAMLVQGVLAILEELAC